MKKLRKIAICLVLCFALAISFSACGGKQEESDGTPSGAEPTSPEVVENWQSVSLSYEEWEEVAEELDFSIFSYSSKIYSNYANGTSIQANQQVIFDDGVLSKIEVSGSSNYSAYIFNGRVYFTDGTKSLYSVTSACNGDASYLTYVAYDYMDLSISPAKSKEFYIYDGSIFKDLVGAFRLTTHDLSTGSEIADTSKLSFVKLCAENKTNYVISCNESEGESTVITARFIGDEIYSIGVEIVSNGTKHTVEISKTETNIDVPSFDGFVSEVIGESTTDKEI